MTTDQDAKDMNLNPTGKGGFGDHPEHRNNGFWRAEDSISFQYKKFLKMSVEEFLAWEGQVKESERTVAQSVAYAAAKRARGSLPHLKEVTDRTEGKPPQSVDLTSAGQPMDSGLVAIGKLAEALANANRDRKPNDPHAKSDEGLDEAEGTGEADS